MQASRCGSSEVSVLLELLLQKELLYFDLMLHKLIYASIEDAIFIRS
jgi:hypothetical protein